MTRKDYVAIAGILKETPEYIGQHFTVHLRPVQVVSIVAWRIADLLARDNPRFDGARFLKACGVQS